VRMHHPELRKVAEVDDEVRQWLAETYANARTSSPHMLRDANHSAALRRVLGVTSAPGPGTFYT